MSTTQPVSISAGEQIDLTERVDLDPGGSHEIISLATPGNPVVGYQAGPDPKRLCGPSRASVVIPALNEAANLPHVLDAAPGSSTRSSLVDGHSIDDTDRRRARLSARRARDRCRDGHGQGQRAGLRLRAPRPATSS